MKKAFLLAIHELKLYFVDKGDLMFSLLLPIIVFALMYFGFGGDTMFNGTANIVNEDEGGIYSEELLGRLAESDSITIEYYSEEDAEIRLERSDLLMVAYIPEDFSEKLESGQSATITFRQRGNGGQEGQIIASIISGIAGDINLEMETVKDVTDAVVGTGITGSQIETTVQKYLDNENSDPVVDVTETVVGSSPDVINQYLPGVVNMFVLFSISMSARMIVEERKRGTLERLMTTRLSVGQMFTGKFLANVFRGLLQTIILLALAYAVFQLFTPLTFVECLVIALLFSAAATGLGMIIAALSKTEDAATWIAVFLTMAMVMLGGTFFVATEGSVLETIGKFSIVTYANDAFRTIIADNGSLADLWLEMAILSGVFVAGMVISRLLFKIIPGGK